MWPARSSTTCATSRRRSAGPTTCAWPRPVLRELYLVPFEACVREAGVAVVMAGYNAVQRDHDDRARPAAAGTSSRTSGASPASCCRTGSGPQHRGHRRGRAGPGHARSGRAWGETAGRCGPGRRGAEEVIDDKVLRLLRLAGRVGAVTNPVRRQAAARVSGNGGRAGRVSWMPVDAGGDPGAGRPGERGVDSGAAGDGDALLSSSGAGRRLGADPRRRRSRKHVLPPGCALADPGLLRRAAVASFVLLRNDRQDAPAGPRHAGQPGGARPERTLAGHPRRRQRRGQPGDGVRARRRAAPRRWPAGRRLPAPPGAPTGWRFPSRRRLADRPADRAAGSPARVPRPGRRGHRQPGPAGEHLHLVGRPAGPDRLGRAGHDRAARQVPGRVRRPAPDRRLRGRRS